MKLSWQKRKEYWWYRFLRVFYGAVLLCALSVVGWGVFVETAPVQVLVREKSKLVCLVGNEQSYSYEAIGVESPLVLSFHREFSDNGLLSSDSKIKNINICESEEGPTLHFLEEGSRKNFDLSGGQLGVTHTKEEVYSSEENWFFTFFSTIFSLFGVWLAWELVRRIFYYIVFGKFWINSLENK